MIESLQKTKALIEIALRFGRVGCDLARIGAEAVVEWLLPSIQIRADQCQRRPDHEVKDFGGRFHKWSRQTIRLLSAATGDGH